jgi:hypothetical protein
VILQCFPAFNISKFKAYFMLHADLDACLCALFCSNGKVTTIDCFHATHSKQTAFIHSSNLFFVWDFLR